MNLCSKLTNPCILYISSHIMKNIMLLLYFCRALLISPLTNVSFRAFSGKGTHTKPFFFHLRQRTSPPSRLPGIPRSIPAIENVKNEGREEEGAMSAAAGRVLSHCTHFPQSTGLVFVWSGWDLTQLS